MATIAQLLQSGQPDMELAACTPRVLLAPFYTTSPVLTIADSGGGLDANKVGYGTSPFVTVGNYEKKAGAKLSNKPTVNKIMSAGVGGPTRNLFSESGKGITYTPQETNLTNLQNTWGFVPSMVGSPDVNGAFTIGIPELPARTIWRVVLIAGDIAPSGNPVYLYWIANRAEVGDRQDVQAVDSNVYEQGVTLDFQTDAAVGEDKHVIFGICGQGWVDLAGANNTGFAAAPSALTGITLTVAPTGTTMTVAPGANHTKQITITDSNSLNVTSAAHFGTSDHTKATVTAGGLVTAVAAGSPVITATYGGYSATYSPTVS